MLENFIMMKKMEKEFIIIKKEINMKENFQIMLGMEKEYIIMIMGTNL